MKSILLILLIPTLLSGCVGEQANENVVNVENYQTKTAFFGIVEINSTAEGGGGLRNHFTPYGSFYPPSIQFDEEKKTAKFLSPEFLWGLQDFSAVVLVIDSRESPIIRHTESNHAFDYPGYAVNVQMSDMSFWMRGEGEHLGSFYFGPYDFGRPFDVFTLETLREIEEDPNLDLSDRYQIQYLRAKDELGYNSTSDRVEEVTIAYDTTISFTYHGLVRFVPHESLEGMASDAAQIRQERDLHLTREALKSRWRG